MGFLKASSVIDISVLKRQCFVHIYIHVDFGHVCEKTHEKSIWAKYFSVQLQPQTNQQHVVFLSIVASDGR